MMRLQQLFYAQFPDWARPDNPVMRYVRGQPNNRLRRMLIAAASAVIVLSLVFISLIAHESGDPVALGSPRKWTIYNVLYFPMLVVQFLTLALALLTASTAVSTEQQRGTWEVFRTTGHGAELVMRARWAAVLYQLRGPLLLLLVPRLIFAVLMLVDVTDYEGYHLDLYLYGITPDIPLEGAVLLLAALMTAAVLAFPVMIGLNAALGLLIAAVFHSRTKVFFVRLTVLAIEIALVALAMQAGREVLDIDPVAAPIVTPPSTQSQWAGLLLIGTLGDQSLRFMDLETSLQTWPDVDYGVLLGGVLLLAVIVQIGLIRLLLALAARQASRPLKE